MRPILFSIGAVPIPAFFFTIMVGALCMTWAAYRMAPARKLSQIVILDMGILGIVASIIGARIFHIMVERPDYYGILWQSDFPWVRVVPEQLIRVFYYWQGGFVSLGAFIASVIAWGIYFRCRHLPVLPYLDIAGATCPIVDFFVRLGCLLVGCCYGKPTAFPLHLVFTNPVSTAYQFGFGNTPLHATQPYFMVNAIVAFFFLRYRARRQRFPGALVAGFLIYYGITRFLIEFLRGDADRGLYFYNTISTGQIVMLIFIAAGILVQWYGQRKAAAA